MDVDKTGLGADQVNAGPCALAGLQALFNQHKTRAPLVAHHRRYLFHAFSIERSA